MKFKDLKEWKEKLKQDASESDKQAKTNRVSGYKRQKRVLIRLGVDQTTTKRRLMKDAWRGYARRLKGLYS